MQEDSNERDKVCFPKAMLIDMDDTILIDDSGPVDEFWRQACEKVISEMNLSLNAEDVIQAIFDYRDWYWSDEERHRLGRLDLNEARVQIAYGALNEKLKINNYDLARCIGLEYARLRDESIKPIPGAIETLEKLKSLGLKLVLITNGGAKSQREKIERFGLEKYFDLILIEGEQEFGKPDSRVYLLALNFLGLSASDVWMIGDNLKWEVEVPKSLGIYSVWVDYAKNGTGGSNVVPDRIVKTISELI